jgi:hypothetical protein
LIFQTYERDFSGISEIEKIDKHKIELNYMKNQEYLLLSWENQLDIFDLNNFDDIFINPISLPI